MTCIHSAGQFTDKEGAPATPMLRPGPWHVTCYLCFGVSLLAMAGHTSPFPWTLWLGDGSAAGSNRIGQEDGSARK